MSVYWSGKRYVHSNLKLMTNRKLHVRFRWHQGQWLGWPWTATSPKFLGISFDFADFWGKTAKRMMIDPIVIVAPKCTFQQHISSAIDAMGPQSQRSGRKWRFSSSIREHISQTASNAAMVTINVKRKSHMVDLLRFRRCWPSYTHCCRALTFASARLSCLLL